MMTRLAQSLKKLGVLDFVMAALRRLGLLKAAYRAYEKGIAFDARRQAPLAGPQTAGWPLPPAELMVLVAGTADVNWFLTFGRSMQAIIASTLEKNGVPLASLASILEFGCGCGRVLRHWPARPETQLHGVDYNPRLIDWCRQYLPMAQFATNQLRPPLAFADGACDCVYAISVFTHMGEALQVAWMRELRRVIRPGGYLLITVHGPSYRERLTPAERADFDGGRLVVRDEDASGMNLCSAYHPPAYVRQRLSAGYAVMDVVPAGAEGVVYQDLYLLRRG